MLLTHLGHACILLEMADTRILIDPGGFSADFTGERDLAAVVITHQHPDHLDAARLPALLAGNPDALVFADPQSIDVLAGIGVRARSHDPAGTRVGAVTLAPVGEQHALIHPDIPRISNVGVLAAAPGEPSFYHPGDCLDNDPGQVDVLAFPLNAPWQRSREMTAFLRRIGARHAVPIHDGLLNANGRALYLGQAARLGSPDTEIVDLAGRGGVDFAA